MTTYRLKNNIKSIRHNGVVISAGVLLINPENWIKQGFAHYFEEQGEDGTWANAKPIEGEAEPESEIATPAKQPAKVKK